MRTLLRVYEATKPQEQQLFGSVVYLQAQSHVKHGRIDQALALLKEAAEAGSTYILRAKPMRQWLR